MNQKNIYAEQESFQKYFLKLFICGDNIWDLVPMLTKEASSKDLDGFYNETHSYLGWRYFLHENISTDIAVKIKNKIEADFTKPNEREKNNVVICRLSNVVNQEQKYIDLIIELSKIKLGCFQPIIIIVSENGDVQFQVRETIKEANKQMKINPNHGVNIDLRDLIGVQVLNNDLTEFNRRIMMIACYYNHLGDKFAFPPIIKDNNKEGVKPKGLFLRTYNIVLIGASVSGKSTFINQILNEKRSLERKGVAEVLNYMEYNNNDYPIVFYDTKGFETDQDKEQLVKVITELNNEKQKKSDKIHLIIYFINSSNYGLKSGDIKFITLLKKFNIEMMMLVTFCENCIKGKDKVVALTNCLTKNKMNMTVCSINNRLPLLGFNDLLFRIYTNELEKSKAKLDQDDIQLENKIDDITSETLYKIGNYLIRFLRKEIFELLMYWNIKESMFSLEKKSIEITKLLYSFLGLKINTKDAIEVRKTFNIHETMNSMKLILNDQPGLELSKDSLQMFNLLTNIDQTGTIDYSEGIVFKKIYDMLIFGIGNCLQSTNMKLFIQYVLPLILVGCKALTLAFEEASLSMEVLDKMIIEDQNAAIDSFEAISKLSKFNVNPSNETQGDRLGATILQSRSNTIFN